MRDADAPNDIATRVAGRCLALILGITALDVAIILACRALGLSGEGVVPLRFDLFGDYFKLILSYPGGGAIHASNLFGLGDIIARYQASHDYAGVEGLASGHHTNLNVMPLTIAFCLLTLRAMAWVDPAALFALSLCGLAGWWIAIVARSAADRRQFVLWAMAGLCCYPTAMVVMRGNLYAGFAGLLLIQSMLIVLRTGRPVTAGALLALACCVRPNAAIFMLPLLIFARGDRVKAMIWFVAIGAATTGVALAAAHALLPSYTLTTFRAALRLYYKLYVEQDLGLAYGSSAFGALKLLIGYRPGLDTLAMVPMALILAATAALAARGTLRPASLLFLTASAYTLGSTVLADYHLLPFLIAPMVLAGELRDGPLDARARAIAIASCVVLAPKNLAFPDSGSWQIVANPLILAAASLQVLWEEWRSVEPARAAALACETA